MGGVYAEFTGQFDIKADCGVMGMMGDGERNFVIGWNWLLVGGMKKGIKIQENPSLNILHLQAYLID